MSLNKNAWCAGAWGARCARGWTGEDTAAFCPPGGGEQNCPCLVRAGVVRAGARRWARRGPGRGGQPSAPRACALCGGGCGGLVTRAVPPAEQVPSLCPLLPGDGRAKPPRHRELQREEQTLAGSAGHSAPCAGLDFCWREPESRRFSAADQRIGTHTGSKQIPLHVHVRLVRHCHAGEKRRRTGGLTAVPIYRSLNKRAVFG